MKASVSADEAVNQILRWVESDCEEDESNNENDLYELNCNNIDNVVEEYIDPDAENQSDGNHTDDNDDDMLVGEGPTRRLHRRKLLTLT